MINSELYVYYVNVGNLKLSLNDKDISSLIERFREMYLTEFEGNIMVVPSLFKEGFEVIR